MQNARIQKILPEGSNFVNVFVLFFYERRKDHITTKSESSSASNRNAIEMAFRLRANDNPTLNVGFVAL